MSAAPDLRAGDVVEIQTSAGLAYAHLTHLHPSYPPAVRALRDLHERRPGDPAALANGPAAFTAMVELGAGLSRLGRRFEVVANVPPADPAFPTFRMPVRDREGRVVYWWFWDGDTLRHAASGEDEALPLREVMTTETFLARLAGG